MPIQHSSFNSNESWLPTNKIKHWTKFTTLLKCNFFFKFEFNNRFSQIPFDCLLCVFLCSDYQVLNASFARFIVEAYCHLWLLLSPCALIVIINCSCWLVHQVSTIKINLCIDYQQSTLTINIGVCINCQHWCLHQLSTLTLALIVKINNYINYHHWFVHSHSASRNPSLKLS